MLKSKKSYKGLIFRGLFLLSFYVFSLNTGAQVIFSESFDEPTGAMAGTENSGTGVTWTSSCPTCVSGDWFEVQSGRLEGKDTNGPASFTSGAISTSGCDLIDVTFDLSESGTMEACNTGCNSGDWVQFEYRVDGGAWQVPGNSFFCGGSCANVDVIQSDDITGGSMNYSSGCLSAGSTLEIRITVQSWAGTEFWRIDNIEVNCISTNPGTNGNVTVCSNEASIDLFNQLGGTPDNGGSWSGPSGLTNGDQGTYTPGTNTSGTYTYTVGPSGCQASSDVVVTENTAPGITGTTDVDPTCGGNNGSIEVNINGGAAPINYSNDNGTTFQPGNQFTNLPAGTYDIVVEDANGCQDNISVTLSNSTGPSITGTTYVDPTCGGNNGSIEVNVNGGAAPLTYSNDNGTTFQPGNQFTNLPAGTYDIVVEDANGCQDNISVTLSNSTGPGITGTTDVDPTCGNNNGSIEVNVNGGAAPITYSNDNGTTFQPGNQFTNLPAGTYDIVVEDANGCQDNISVTLSNVAGPGITGTTDVDPTCGGNNGSIEVNINGGTAPITYSNDNGSTFQPGNQFTNLSAGTYDIVIEDANGCQDNVSVTLSNAAGPGITGTIDVDPTCGNNNGSIEVNVNGGAAPLTYSNDNGSTFQPGNQFTNLSPGTYDIVVEDANGCQDNISVTLVNTPPPTFTVSGQNPSCQDNDGVITISGLDPNSNFDLAYEENGNLIGPNPKMSDASGEINVSGLSSGTYENFEITTSNGCTEIDNTIINLIAPPSHTVDAGTDVDVCQGDAVTLTADNPDGANISWDNGVTDGVGFTAQNTQTYTVTAQLNGCSVTDQVTVNVHPIPVIDPVNDVNLCPNDIFGGVIFSADIPGTTFQWTVLSGNDFGLGTSGNGDMSALNQPLPVGLMEAIEVTPTSDQGCVGLPVTFDVEVLAGPTAQFSPDQTSGCAPLEIAFNNTSTGQVQCQWDFGDGNQDNNCQNVTHTYSGLGQYDVTLTVTDADGCSDMQLQQNLIQVNPSPEASFAWYPENITVEDTEVEFVNNSSGATQYTWVFENQNDTLHSTNVTYEFPKVPNDNQVITLIALNGNCVDQIQHHLAVQDVLLYYVPNTFTPDGDFHNQYFKPVFTSGFDPYDYRLMIFNRWGEPLFESHNATVGWDGTYNGKSVPDGTYVWQIEFKRLNTDDRVKVFGHVNLLR